MSHFSGLDPVNSNLIKDEIYRLAHNGASIIFSTHRMEQVEEICDHIILMNKGEKILDGSVSGVKQQFKENLFGVGIEGTASPDNNGWKPESAAFEVVGQRDAQWVVRIRDGYRPNDVLRYLIDNGKGITAFTEILPSLSDIFIRLVEGTPLARQFQPVNLSEMKKMWLITRREYLTRVRNKTFLLSTFLLPVVFILIHCRHGAAAIEDQVA